LLLNYSDEGATNCPSSGYTVVVSKELCETAVHSLIANSEIIQQTSDVSLVYGCSKGSTGWKYNTYNSNRNKDWGSSQIICKR
jgi:hypothetical protein